MFLTDPGLVPIPTRPDFWWLDGPLVWNDRSGIVTIPAGFICDDASIPKFLDWIPFLDRQGLSRRPGLLHDGIYAIGRERWKDWADNTLRAACLDEGMSTFGASVIYHGVHWFGESSWEADGHYSGGAESCDFIAPEYWLAFVAAGRTIYS